MIEIVILGFITPSLLASACLGILGISFQRIKPICLAKDHWRWFSNRNAHMVDIVNWIRFNIVYIHLSRSLLYLVTWGSHLRTYYHIRISFAPPKLQHQLHVCCYSNWPSYVSVIVVKSRFWLRFCVVTLIFLILCWYRDFCHRIASDLFLFLSMQTKVLTLNMKQMQH